MKLSRELLQEEYIEKRKSVKQIAVEQGLKSHNSVIKALKKYTIPRRPSNAKDSKRYERRQANWRGCGDIPGAYWCSKRYHAKIRKLALSVTIQEMWQLFLDQKGLCALSGVSICFPIKGTIAARVTQTASLDRKDSSLGYVSGNVQWVHKVIQRMKMNMPDEAFREWCFHVTNRMES